MSRYHRDNEHAGAEDVFLEEKKSDVNQFQSKVANVIATILLVIVGVIAAAILLGLGVRAILWVWP